MQATITIEKWTQVDKANPGKVKTSGQVTISGKVEVVGELIELLKAAGYTVT